MLLKQIERKKIFPIIISAMTMVISLLTSFFVARPLGSELYGKVQFYIGVAGTLTILGGIGLTNYLTKNTQYAEEKKPFFTKWIILASFFNLLLLPLYVVFAFYVLSTFEKNLFLIICVGIMSFVMTILEIIGAFLLGSFKPDKSSFFQNFLPKASILIASVIMIFCLGIKDRFAQYYVYCCIIIYVLIDAFFLIIFIRKTKIHYSKKELLELASFFAISCTYGLVNQLSKVIGGAYYGNLSMVGIYSISLQLIMISNIFSGTITTISKPHFASYKEDTEKLLSYFRKITRINSYIVIPFLVGFIIQSKDILSFFGDSYTAYPLVLTILCIGGLVSDLTGPNGTLLVMADHEKLEFLNGFITISSFLLFAFTFKSLGIIGLALSNCISTILTNIAKFIEVWVIYKKCPYNCWLLLHYLIMGAISAACFLGISFIKNLYVELAIDIIVGITLIFLFNVVNPNKDDKYFFFKKE